MVKVGKRTQEKIEQKKEKPYESKNDDKENLSPYIEIPLEETVALNSWSPPCTGGCSSCNKSNNIQVETSFQGAAYAWGFIFLISGGILWSWVPFVLDDFKRKVFRCSQCTKIIKDSKMKSRQSTEKLFCFLLVMDILILATIAFYFLFR